MGRKYPNLKDRLYAAYNLIRFLHCDAPVEFLEGT